MHALSDDDVEIVRGGRFTLSGEDVDRELQVGGALDVAMAVLC